MVDVPLHELARTLYQEGGQLLLIDEVHKRRGFARELKAAHDTFDLRLLFSGSSALRMDHELADLSRRAVVHRLPVLSFREFLEIETGEAFPAWTLEERVDNHQACTAAVCTRIRPIAHFRNYLRYGAYPYYRESLQSYTQKLVETVNVTIDVDLCGLYNIEPSKRDTLRKILYMLCSTTPAELNKSKLSAAVGASWPTVSNYLERMEAGSLLRHIRCGSGMRAVRRHDKLLLDNPNLFFALCAAPDIGSLRESFFVSQVSHGHQVHYHDRGDFLVDERLVFEIGGAGKTGRQFDRSRRTMDYVVADDIETGTAGTIPLWLFGMGY